jgi:hypothetical protein
MLKNAVLSFYQAGHRRQAQQIYNQMRELYPLEEFKSPSVEEYVKIRLHEEIKDLIIYDAKEAILLMLREAYFRYAVRDDDEAFGRERMAEQVWDYYQNKYESTDRIDLPDFKVMRYLALQDFLNDTRYPRNLRGNLLGRIKVERPKLFEQLLGEEKKLEKESEQLD